MKRNILITLLILICSFLYFSNWIGCHVDTRFFYSALDTKLRVIFDIRSDATTFPFVAKLFHNKIVQGSMDIFNAYISFWDIRFLLILLSPLTLFGIGLRIFYSVKEKARLNFLEKILGIIFLLIPLILLIHLVPNQPLGLFFFAFPLVVFSLSGFFLFLKKQKYAWGYILILFVFSLWLLVALPSFLIDFCHA